MQLNLRRPLIFFDIESTGLNIITDRIVQLSYIKVLPNGDEQEHNLLINPGMHIPDETTAIHHITDEMVKDKPMFKDIAKKLADDWKGCDLAGFNSTRFDIPLLVEEMLRAKVDFEVENRSLIDVMNIFHKKERRDLTAAYKFYCGKDLDGAHSADADTRATYEVLKAQLDRYDDLSNDVEYLHEFSRKDNIADIAGNFSYNAKHEPCFNFGKYKGIAVTEVFRKDPSYYVWIMDGQFAQSTKRYVTKIKLQMMSSKK
ncbi:MAG: 3'-5' exonuclease [Bacteroidales bacterium]|nr:3'-5' exonuclease [Candidatus Liminaster caballi]